MIVSHLCLECSEGMCNAASCIKVFGAIDIMLWSYRIQRRLGSAVPP
jgi:hypothetical protein